MLPILLHRDRYEEDEQIMKHFSMLFPVVVVVAVVTVVIVKKKKSQLVTGC